MTQQNGYGNYLKQEVESASQGKLVLLMYEAAIRFTRQAIAAIEEKNIQEAHNNIIRTENIIYELIATLDTDKGGEIADSLMRLYDFVIWELIEANSTKNKVKLEGVLKVITPLKEAWKEVVSNTGGVKPLVANGKQAPAPMQKAGTAAPADAGAKSINISG